MKKITSRLKTRKRKKGTGTNISVYFDVESFDVLNHLRDLADKKKIVSTSVFIRDAVIEKYHRDISQGEQ